VSASPASNLLSVVVVTYEWPEALDAVLRSLSEQTDSDFEVVVADDGSGPETRATVEHWREHLAGTVRHVWQPDEGYRRARILDAAALAATGEYLVFLDGDCLVRRRSIEAIRRASLPGWFLASKRLNLSKERSRRVLDDRLPVWRWSALTWLLRAPAELATAPRQAARPGVLVPIRDRRRPWRVRQPEFSPPYDGYGFFLGVARSDFERVNGFDTRFEGWGGEDVDLAVRLRRSGLRCGWPGPRATVLHLWHQERKGHQSSNAPLVDDTKQSDRIEAILGLRELSAELAAQEIAKRVTSSSSSSDPV
jgi:glycosyltransferase involved in cell wall biosynthesis